MFSRVLNRGRNVAAQTILHGGKGVGASLGAMRNAGSRMGTRNMYAAKKVHAPQVGTSSGAQGELFNASKVKPGRFGPPLVDVKVPSAAPNMTFTPAASRSGRFARAGAFARRHPAMTAGAGIGAAGFATGRMTSGRQSGRPTPGQTIRGGTPGAGGTGPVGGGRPGTGRPTV